MGCTATREEWQEQMRPITDSSAERDPDGIGANQPGSKLDAGKPRFGLVLGDFSRALTEVVRVGTFGADKYTDHGWLHVRDGIARYTDAMGRHWFGEVTDPTPADPQTGLLHAAHLAWNALARLELMLRESQAAQPQEGKGRRK